MFKLARKQGYTSTPSTICVFIEQSLKLEATEASKEYRTAARNARDNDHCEDEEGIVYQAGIDI